MKLLLLGSVFLTSGLAMADYVEKGTCVDSFVYQFHDEAGKSGEKVVEGGVTELTRKVTEGEGQSTFETEGSYYDFKGELTSTYTAKRVTRFSKSPAGLLVESSITETTSYPYYDGQKGEARTNTSKYTQVYKLESDGTKTLVEHFVNGQKIELAGVSFELKAGNGDLYSVSYEPLPYDQYLGDRIMRTELSKSVCIFKRQ